MFLLDSKDEDKVVRCSSVFGVKNASSALSSLKNYINLKNPNESLYPFTTSFVYNCLPFGDTSRGLNDEEKVYVGKMVKENPVDDFFELFKKVDNLYTLYEYLSTKPFPFEEDFKKRYPDIAAFAAMFKLVDLSISREEEFFPNIFSSKSLETERYEGCNEYDYEVMDHMYNLAKRNTFVVRKLNLSYNIRGR